MSVRRSLGRGTTNSVLSALLLTSIVVSVACRGGESQGPIEPSANECPTSGERTCKDSGDCGSGNHCTGGRCFANQAGCPCTSEETADCGSQAHCTRGQCYLNQAGTPCTTTKQCGPRAHCTVDTCYSNASGSPCSESADCGPSSACVSGKCN